MNLSAYFIMGFSFFVHSFMFTLLAKRYFVKERFPMIFRIIICLINAITSPLFINLLEVDNVLAYSVFTAVILLEVVVLFQDKLSALIAIMLSIIIHFFFCRSIVLGIQSLYLQISMHDIINNYELLLANTFIVLWVHIFILFLVITIIPPSAVKQIIIHNTLLYFIVFLMAMFGAYLIYNSTIFGIDIFLSQISIQQILLPILLMCTFYLLLLFMIRLVMVEEYKNLIVELENKVNKSEMLTNALFNLADIVFEFNITQNKVVQVLVKSVELPFFVDNDLNDFLQNKFSLLLHSDYKNLINKIDAEYLKSKFEEGKKDFDFEYLSHKISFNKESKQLDIANDIHLWHRMKISIKLGENSDDIIAICTIDEIDAEKKSELKLVEKSEKDALTGAYNKLAIETLVTKYLKENTSGVLFVFDIDFFKSINDNLGHSFGDDVLKEIHIKIKTIFRADDYIGRFGGDEFVAFIKGNKSHEEIKSIANRVCDSIRKKYTTENGDVLQISSSIGISIAPNNGYTYEELFNAADIALYKAKSNGKDNYYISDNNAI